MYTVNNQTVADIISGNGGRTFRAVMEFTDGTKIEADQIFRIDTNGQSSAEEITPGAVISQGISAEIANLTEDITDKTFVLYWYLVDLFTDTVYDELIPAGRYKVESCKKNGVKWTVTAKDGLSNSDEEYIPTISYPALTIDVEREICNKLGVYPPQYPSEPLMDSAGEQLFTSDEEPIYVLESPLIVLKGAPEKCTMREMLGYIASLDSGKFAVLDRLGRLTHENYEETDYIVNYTAEPETEQTTIKYTQIACTVDENTTLSAGDYGRKLSFENPYMTSDLFEKVTEKYMDFEYNVCSVNQLLGDPRLDVWDIVNVPGSDGGYYKVPIMQLSFAYDGGISANIVSTGKPTSKANSAKSDGPLIRNVKKIVQNAQTASEEKLKESFKESIDYITGNEGGYVVTKLNADGQPIATYYTDNLDINQATDLLLVNNKGIAGTTNGVNGPYNLAIDIQGRINASQILTGILSAIVLQSLNFSETNNTGSQINLEDGTFSFAGGAMTYKNGQFSINGGNINIKTNSKNDSRIKLSYNEWEIEMSPLQLKLTNSTIGGNLVFQAGAIFGMWNDEYKYVLNSESGNITTYTDGGKAVFQLSTNSRRLSMYDSSEQTAFTIDAENRVISMYNSLGERTAYIDFETGTFGSHGGFIQQ